MSKSSSSLRSIEEIDKEYQVICIQYGDKCLKVIAAESAKQALIKRAHELFDERIAVELNNKEKPNVE